jgi:hypothetical protein
MKSKLNRVFFLAAALAAAVSAAPLAADPPTQVGRLSLLSGSVSFHPQDVNEWVAPALNYPVTVGDHLWTDNGGRVEIQVASAAIRLDSLSEISFEGLDDQTVQVRVSQGSLNVRIWDSDPGDVFEVDTPNAQVSLVSNGSYRIDVQPDGDTLVTVRQGQAQAMTGAGMLSVAAGQQATVSGLQSFSYYVVTAPMADEWDRWCLARDARIDNVAAVQYVPRGMIGVEDLDENGTWIVVASYGRVWAPNNVPMGWAPYRYGHWAYVQPWGWTWIDDAAWGFAPFHYGRWAQVNGRWCWLPGAGAVRPVYAPALVVFLGDQTDAADIGWFPLGPGEVYIPPYQVADSYVVRLNVTVVPRVTVESIRAYQVDRVNFANRVNPAVTMVPRQVFVSSRPAAPSVIRVPSQVSRAPIAGMRAPATPQRESYAGQQPMARTNVPQPSAEIMTRRTFMGPQPRQQQPQAGGQLQPNTARQPQAGGQLQPQPNTMMRQPAGAQPQPQPNTTMRQPAQVQPQPNTPTRQPQPQGNGQGNSGRGNAQQAPGQGDAASLIASVKQMLPGAEQRLAAARKTPRLQYDFNAASQQLAAARASIADADRAYAARNFAAAQQNAAAAQSQIQNEDGALSAALRAAGSGSKDDSGRGNADSQQQGGQPQGGRQQGGQQQGGRQQAGQQQGATPLPRR